MLPPIDVEPVTFDAASKVFGREMVDTLNHARTALLGALQGTGAMAGSDQAGTKWAGSYDTAVVTTLGGLADVTNACTQLGALLEQTGFNHGMAESKSDPTKSVPTPADTGKYVVNPPVMACVPGQDVPPAEGGSGSAPTGWGLVESAVGYLWPNGHQDRLRTAGTAWSNAAESIGDVAYYVPEALQAIAFQKSPEISDATTSCSAMTGHLNDLSSACTQLAQGCSDFAGYIDTCHSNVEHELVSLVEWTAGIEAAGAIAGFFSFGIGEGAAQGVEATRIAATAARIADIIGHLVELAGTVGETIANAVTKVVEVSSKLKALLGARLSVATAEAVDELPAVAKTAEELADEGLTYEAESNAADDALYEKYVKAKQAKGKDPISRDAWQKKVDSLRTNKATGDAYRDQVAEDLGITPGEDGWKFEVTDKNIPGRRFDIANPTTKEAIEVKSGTTPTAEGLTQLDKDEQAIQDGWTVTWSLKTKLSSQMMARLQQLAEEYPGRFNYTIAGG